MVEDQLNREPGHQDDGPPTYTLSSQVIEEVANALSSDDLIFVRSLVSQLHAADLADLIEQLTSKNRRKLVETFRGQIDPLVLSELEHKVRDEIIDLLEPEDIAAAVAELDTDDAVYLLEDLSDEDRAKVLDAVPLADRADLEAGLGYPEETAGRLMQRNYIAVPSFWTVGQTIDYLRENEDLPNDFYEIFVVDPKMKPVGTIRLNSILRTARPVKVEEIMEAEPILINAHTDQEEVAYAFQQYDLVSALVVDDENRLLGSIMVDDIVDVIKQEAEEDIMLLSGVSEGGVYESTFRTTRDRFVWLLANLGTAIAASLVIGMFDATIEQMVALAVLMPIVASMGGNAGTQTLTVAVRALATKDLTHSNALRIVNRELIVGSINGVLFAVLIGLIAAAWFSNPLLGGVIAMAMVINLVVAALSGILIPLGLERMGVDPAIASTVFVTTVTDVVGFFAFLGLAAIILI